MRSIWNRASKWLARRRRVALEAKMAAAMEIAANSKSCDLKIRAIRRLPGVKQTFYGSLGGRQTVQVLMTDGYAVRAWDQSASTALAKAIQGVVRRVAETKLIG